MQSSQKRKTVRFAMALLTAGALVAGPARNADAGAKTQKFIDRLKAGVKTRKFKVGLAAALIGGGLGLGWGIHHEAPRLKKLDSYNFREIKPFHTGPDFTPQQLNDFSKKLKDKFNPGSKPAKENSDPRGEFIR